MKNIIEANGLIKKFNKFKLEITESIPEGYITGIIGANGAGKTTFINTILNIIKSDSGSIFFDKENITEESFRYKDQLGIVFDSNIYPSFWTPNILEKAINTYYTNWSNDIFTYYLYKFGINGSKKISSLSKGMQMKLMIAVALAHDPKVLILDEPTSGLDPISRDELLTILQDYVEIDNHSVIFSTHITSDLEKIADYIIYLNKGKVIYSGDKNDFIEKYKIVQGSKSNLSKNQLEKVIAEYTYSYGFKALIKDSDSELFLEDTYKISSASIDEIMIFMNKSLS